ncbi:universal stress protein [Alicyclobacillus kakegawensis]|uniref:universal stress protein n=1 Tax=Alicyclobacillus kakegawensis TaxID=392012 RepID=UPI0008327EE2|nr:universal stress protein [Alicyclobacillus kakegawensis]
MNTVILAIDGSKPSEKAVATAADLLRHYPEARLIVVYAVNPPAFAGGGPVPPSVFEILDQEAQNLWERTQKALDGVLDRATFRSPTGHPVQVICSLAEQENADLIVMGSHGRSAIDRVILGSVSHGVLNRAARPVLVVR